jgi:hypothetical protein
MWLFFLIAALRDFLEMSESPIFRKSSKARAQAQKAIPSSWYSMSVQLQQARLHYTKIGVLINWFRHYNIKAS